jgi:hypothetical protein
VADSVDPSAGQIATPAEWIIGLTCGLLVVALAFFVIAFLTTAT